MLVIACGTSNAGKTYWLSNYVVPALLTDPREIFGDAAKDIAPDVYRRAFIHDPPTRRAPKGQYAGPHYHDLADWRRKQSAGESSRVRCFVEPDTEQLCATALEWGDSVVVLDEMEFHLSHETHLPKHSPLKRLIHKGRHANCVLVGTMRGLKGVKKEARRNIMVCYFGGLSEIDDRIHAAKTAGVPIRALENLPLHTFLEWNTQTNERNLTKLENGRKVVINRIG